MYLINFSNIQPHLVNVTISDLCNYRQVHEKCCSRKGFQLKKNKQKSKNEDGESYLFW